MFYFTCKWRRLEGVMALLKPLIVCQVLVTARAASELGTSEL